MNFSPILFFLYSKALLPLLASPSDVVVLLLTSPSGVVMPLLALTLFAVRLDLASARPKQLPSSLSTSSTRPESSRRLCDPPRLTGSPPVLPPELQTLACRHLRAPLDPRVAVVTHPVRSPPVGACSIFLNRSYHYRDDGSS